MAGKSDRLTIFMYPWFAMGHITSYLLTANKFAERGHKIVIIIPPKAQSKLGALNLHPQLIQFRFISIPHVEGLPSHVETTNDVAIQGQDLLRHALDLTQPAVESMLVGLKPDFIFFDLMHWLSALGRRLQIKSIYYCTVSPVALGFMFAKGPSIENIIKGPPGFPRSVKLYKHAARDVQWMGTAKELGSGLTLKQRLMTSMCDSDAIGFKTCIEIEGVYCEFLEKKLDKPILVTGPILVQKTQANNLINVDDEKWDIWLNGFQSKTVIFCAFGSEAVLEQRQFEQLLLGIELTGLPFAIALRPPIGFETIEEAIPNGFKERTQERGVVDGGWVPQQLILKHPAVGCFVTHCGYGSSWEGLTSECQLVLLPHLADQYFNARLLSEDLRVGVEVEKGDEDGVFTKEGVHGAIMAAMADDSRIGKEIRANHEKLRELFNEEFEDSCFDNFIQKLRSL
ncbi:hypothetical protein BUALT_Bualt03G0051300 [Buddleja alternifolia]|uniref:Glycosyltransferase n=1 Tax=Buddleja alternifolia TaxID=168488 RepID=A0AAV6Y221_9LAMI|nr:hypothetical protein BUALT_Bualt03G0051300 [Buddleja alternifolia]